MAETLVRPDALPLARARRPLPASRVQLYVAVLASVAFIAFATVLLTHLGGSGRVRTIDDLTQLVAAAFAGAAAGWAALQASGRMRRSWIAVSGGAFAWALGQAVWCYYELISGRSTPFPSAADAGFLLFPLGSVIGLWLYPSEHGAGARRRWLLDACIVVTALVAVSWATTLGAVAHEGGDSRFAFAVSLAYPIGDIVVLTMALTALCRPSTHRGQLVLLSVAMSAMSLGDSCFTYLTAIGKYQTGGPTDLGWVAAFLLLAVAGVGAATRPPDKNDVVPAEAANLVQRAAAATMLPYLPLVCAVGVLGMRRALGHQPDSVERVAVLVALAMVLVRQYTTVRENRALLDIVAAREAQLHRQAFHDQLTGLANRALFINRLDHALQLHRRDMRPVALLFCDLDDFKAVNDALGHWAGDELLIRVAERLRGTLRPGDTVARLGGDEFAVLVEDGGDAVTVGSRIIAALCDEFTIADTQLSMRASVGIAELLPEQATPTIDTLLAHADIAMYSAKRAGKGQLACYDKSMALPNADDLQLRQPLTRAVAERQILLAYQPIVRMDSGALLGLEALARWTHDGVRVGPATFIPMAQRAGLIDTLTDQILDQACNQLSRWSSRLGHDRLRVSVNIPPTLMSDSDFPNRVARVIDRHGLKRNQLVLEITEDALLEDLQTARAVTGRLRDLGTRLSLDDFGKGYSSLLRLRQMPLDSLKIDQAFLANIDFDPDAERFVAALLALGRDLGLDVIAEGIERTGQGHVLRRLGCRYAQGYLFGRPGTAADVEPYVLGRAAPFFHTPALSA
ncbi:MAG: sensor-containing diguanylate cyclase/phosphodiesterase [Pseudonocardiales bacterium]|nr:sensor-containing diguanylate cyclase/phosphodiesterase [Pseudonocardiales bacterium]